ncbi:MAG: hypothetical protein J6386_13070 [Candidatus Synoicihabitans palmerolidicus]|nr:hypothetical protein [Candidatus Synoicihabitans palmerolidicus]
MEAGDEPLIPFLPEVMPQRNHDTVLRLVSLLAEEELDARWLPLLRVWRESEIKRVKSRLGELIGRLENG